MALLAWEGKHPASSPHKIKLPFQTVETINESVSERQRSLDLFQTSAEGNWRNRLVWGDNKYVLPSLMEELGGKVNLIYIDPPFDTGSDFSFVARLGACDQEIPPTTFLKEPSAIEQKAYRDTWGKGLNSYLSWFHSTIQNLRQLLSDTGSIFVHLDWHVSAYAKVLLDEVFGMDNFRSEIIWKRSNPKSHAFVAFPTCTDTIFYYSKGDNYVHNRAFEAHNEEYVEAAYKYEDEQGRYRLLPLLNPSDSRPNLTYEFLGVTRVWRWTRERMQRAHDAGLVVQLKPGSVPQYKKYLEDSMGRTVTNCWTDINQAAGNESVDYPTQKPEALLRRIIETATSSGDLVLDCFAGSGTTAAVAEKLGRRWITCDLGRFAIHTTRKRLLGIPNVKPFVVQNLGKYERQQWQVQEFGENAEAKIRAYRKFILDLYKAQELHGKVWLHGIKGQRMVHVGSVDSPVSAGDVTQIAKELKQLIGTGEGAPQKAAVDILGWDFAFEINELAKQQAQSAGIDAKFVHIPREVLEKKAVEQGDIKFFELAALSVQTETKKKNLKVELTDFIMSMDDVPEDVRQAVKHWSQWVDYWAIDWDYKGDAFHNQWQSYRTRKDPKLQLYAEQIYEQPGECTLMVKVIDILGNDTTKTIKVKVE